MLELWSICSINRVGAEGIDESRREARSINLPFHMSLHMDGLTWLRMGVLIGLANW